MSHAHQVLRPVKIVRVIARLNIGGPSIHTVELCRHLQAPDYESILVAGRPEAEEGNMSYLIQENGFRRIEVPSMRRSLNLLNDVRAWYQIFLVLWRERPRILHTHTAKAGALGRSAALVYNMAGFIRSRFLKRETPRLLMVHTFHGHVLEHYFGTLKTKMFVMIERFLAKFTDRIVTVSPKVRDDVIRLGIGRADRMEVIRLGLPLDSLLALNLPYKSVEGLQIGIVGRLVPVKNYPLFLDAIYLSRPFIESKSLSFHIFGDGELRVALEAAARRLRIDQHVIFGGWEREMVRVYRRLDIVCLTSLNEGTPVSIIEALAAARPVISTDVGGVRDLMGSKAIDHGFFIQMKHGLLISSGDTQGFKEALKFLVDHPEVRIAMGLAGRQFVKKSYTVKRLVCDIKKLYEEVLL